MNDDDEFIAFIDLIYAAVLDCTLWPTVLERLGELTGTMQSIIATMDRRTNIFDSISRRTIAELDASYKNYWAYHNPLWARCSAQPVGTVYALDTLMAPQDFAKTPIFNEWWKPADYSLAMLGANLRGEEQVSSMICVINPCGHEALTNEQIRLFKAAVPHITRALRIHRQLWTLNHVQGPMPERFEGMHQGAVLVDADANVLFINAAARSLLDAGDGLVLKGGCLATSDGADSLRRLIGSCGRAGGPFLRGRLGSEIEVQRGSQRAALKLTVMPLRSKNPAAEISWLGLRAPVAIVTIADPELSRRRLAQDLHERYGLTAAEAELAAEIVKGDGREAAAKRRGISVATARSQLSSIFEKTRTHRQAELVHLLLELGDHRNLEK